MAKNTSKNSAVTTTKNGVNIDLANTRIATALNDCADLAKEWEIYLEIDRLNAEGFLSVRGIKETILLAETVANAPSLKADYAQQFPVVRALRKVKGAEGKTLKELFNTAVQARKSWGADSALEKVEGAKSYAGLKKSIPSQAERAKARGAGKETADEKKAGKAEKLNPVKVATSLAEYLERGENLPLELLERLADALNEAMNRAE